MLKAEMLFLDELSEIERDTCDNGNIDQDMKSLTV